MTSYVDPIFGRINSKDQPGDPWWAEAAQDHGLDLKFDMEAVAREDSFHNDSPYDFDKTWTAVVSKALSLGYQWPPIYDNQGREPFIRLCTAQGGKRILRVRAENFSKSPGAEPGYSFLNIRYKKPNSGERDMKTNRALNLLDNSFNTIKVVYASDRMEELTPELAMRDKYTFKVPKDYVVEVNDLVVIPLEKHFKVARCVSIDETPHLPNSDREYKWIYGSLNTSMFNSCVDRDDELRKVILDKEKQIETAKMKTFLQESLGFDNVDALKLPGIKVDEK